MKIKKNDKPTITVQARYTSGPHKMKSKSITLTDTTPEKVIAMVIAMAEKKESAA